MLFSRRSDRNVIPGGWAKSAMLRSWLELWNHRLDLYMANGNGISQLSSFDHHDTAQHKHSMSDGV